VTIQAFLLVGQWHQLRVVKASIHAAEGYLDTIDDNVREMTSSVTDLQSDVDDIKTEVSNLER
jgi:peptidoglycan hydrolase CwlO-like protein